MQRRVSRQWCDLGLFLTLNAVARPGEGLQPFQADRASTVNTNAETSIGDPLQCVLNRMQAAAVLTGAYEQGFLRSGEASEINRVERNRASKIPYFLFSFLDRL